MLKWKKLKISIHAPTRGATIAPSAQNKKNVFQSTLPREERHRYNYNILNSICDISIHAPTRGATLLPCVILKAKFISIHAPTRGATVIISGSPCGRLFQSTLPREERLNYYNYAQNSCLAFQSTLPREERLKIRISIAF